MSCNFANKILDVLDDFNNGKKTKGIKICTVKSVSPLILTYDNIEIGASYHDTIYVHPLIISPLISQNVETISAIQNFIYSTAYKSPEFSALIEGSFPDFLKEFYLFFKNWQSIYNLNEGDSVAVFELGANQYLIIQKVTVCN